MKNVKFLVLLALFSLGAASAQEAEQAEQAEQAEKAEQAANPMADLEKVKTSFRESFIHPGYDLSKYDKIYLWEATFEYRDVGPARRYRGSILSSTRKREFGISDKDRQKFEDMVSKAFTEEIDKGKTFTIVDEIVPGSTLILRGGVLDVISKVPPKTIGRSEVYLASIGEGTLIIELIDPQTGEIVALAAERQSFSRPGSNRVDMFSLPANDVTIWADVRRWARRAASKLRKELDKT